MSSAGVRRRKPFTNVNKAFRDLVMDYPGGVEELAARMGRTPRVLYNKAEATEESHNQPTAGDIVVATVVAGDYRVLHAFAGIVDHVCYPMPDMADVSDAALLEMLAGLGAQSGDFHRSIAEGLQDRRYTRKEHNRTANEAYQFIAAIHELVARLEGLIDD